jgi:hypothetical protein
MKRIIATVCSMLIIAGNVSANDLKTYKATYEKNLQEIILSHGIKMSELGQQYTKSLDSLLARVKRAGDLDKTTAVMGEFTRFRKEEAMPDKLSALLDIQTLQSSFANQASSHEVNKAKGVVFLASKYDQALERLQRALVSSSKLDDAKAVQDERKRIEVSEDVVVAKAMVSTRRTRAKKRHNMAGANDSNRVGDARQAMLRRAKKKGLLNISVTKDSGYTVEDVKLRSPCWFNRKYSFKKIPPVLKDARFIKRVNTDDRDGLSSEVTVSRMCDAYVAIMYFYKDKTVFTDDQFADLEKDGWKVVDAEFATTATKSEIWRWKVVHKEIDAGIFEFEPLGAYLIFMLQ